ncbi:hypothetical protein C486_17245 [Natrinema gari JCM 14663]|uniref:Uncharacterized protein n=1 Tax=Natrinema gari JCM 14663 TaxID=1230459 RepID=L9YUQ2_9EURY|nr:hypothetical protein C486_17245 [Natrinema gari JCM 14663]
MKRFWGSSIKRKDTTSKLHSNREIEELTLLHATASEQSLFRPNATILMEPGTCLVQRFEMRLARQYKKAQMSALSQHRLDLRRTLGGLLWKQRV